MEALNKLKVAELKKILKEKHLNTDGNKSVLVQRILAAGDMGSTEVASEHLDTDEDIILGHDESCDVGNVKKAEKTAANLAIAADLPVSTSTVALTKTSLPSQKKSVAANGKMEERIKRFGVVTDDIKKKSRAERFQLNAVSSNQTSSDNGISSKKATISPAAKPGEELLKKRAERFGVAKSAQSLTKSEQNEQLKKRAERFGTSVQQTQDGQSDAMLKRKARFGLASSGDVSVEAKKQKRAERFGSMNS